MKKNIKIILSLMMVVCMSLGVKAIIEGLSNDSFASGWNDTKISIDGKLLNYNGHAIIEEENTYIPVDIFTDYIYKDNTVYDKSGTMIIDFKSPKFTLPSENSNNRIKDGISLNFLLIKRNGIRYIDILDMGKLFQIKMQYDEKRNVLNIDRNVKFENPKGNSNNSSETTSATKKIGSMKRATTLRESQSSFSKEVAKLEKEEMVLVREDKGKWSKIEDEKGNIGFVLTSKIEIKGEVASGNNEVDNSKGADNTTNLNEMKAPWKPNGKINLVWEQLYLTSPDLRKQETIKGLDVISPTWFSITDSEGYVKNKASFDYVKEAHRKGYKVWALVNNSFDKDLTRKILNNKKAQERVIDQLLVYANLYDLDGINIDFENVYYEDKGLLTKFVTYLTQELKKENLVVSMDMTVPEGSLTWSKCYDREELGKVLDYVMVMTYDEHWASSPKSGSVASIGWVDNGIKSTLKLIPNEKVIMGVPFYTRVWEETKLKNGKVKVEARSIAMDIVNKKINEYNLMPEWLENIGQYYIEYKEDGNRHRIWIEDARSIQLKLGLIEKHNIAGAAFWRKGFETPDVWTIIDQELSK